MKGPARHDVTERIITEVLAAAEPGRLVRRALESVDPGPGPWRMVAVGKASAAMAEAALAVWGGSIESGVRVTAGAQGEEAGSGGSLMRAFAVDHPVPTSRNVEAAEDVQRFVREAPADRASLCLLSGGASACLCLPREPLGLGDIAAVTGALLRAGAPIGELNAVRKHCEVLKGGGLAAACGAGRVLTLVLSDVLGDRLDVIGSGPTSPDPTTFADAMAVLEKRGVVDVSPAVTALLRRGCEGLEAETVKPQDPVWERVENRVIGSNHRAIHAAVSACERAGFVVLDRREGVEGEAADVGRRLAREACRIAAGRGGPAAIVWGGETTVTVGSATGLGGRNQELALAAALELDGEMGVTVLSLATDGIDGPTDAAGGMIDGETVGRMRRAGVDPAEALAAHDSHPALGGARALLRTGPTGTNVNDVMVALVR